MKEIHKSSGYIKSFDQTPIYYETRGDGEALVFVYGIACLMNHWRYQVDYFSKKYKTVSFDLRGHQRSQPVADLQNLSLEHLAMDIVELLKELKIKKAHFLGHSFGAPILLKLFETRPELFYSMTFINGFSQNPIKNMFGLNIVEKFFYFIKAQYSSNPTLWSGLWKKAVDNPVSMMMAGLVGGFNLKMVDFKDIEIYANGVSNMDLGIFLKLFESLMDFNGDHILPTIVVPTLVISGGRDNVTPQAFQKKFKDSIPNSEFFYLPYGSHCTQLDFPEYINLKVEDFIERTMFRR